MLKDSFKTFVESLAINVEKLNVDGTESEVEDQEDESSDDDPYYRIVNKLNSSYWQEESDEDHGHIVGSLGRKTAIKGISDMDMLFILPAEVKKDFDSRSENVQSQLLQEVKGRIKEIYPNTIVRGDGQVVVVSMKSAKCEIEVCPVFERSDGAFDYPDSNNGGSWKKTNPIPEMIEAEVMIDMTNAHYQNVCRMIRAWKNNKGFKFGGLLIDTLTYNFFSDEKYKHYQQCAFDDYLQLFTDLFGYLKEQDPQQKYWFALGSRQRVYNKNGKFISRAKKAYNKIKNCTEESDNVYESLQDLFGTAFPVPTNVIEASSFTQPFVGAVRNTEEFIDDMFQVDIRYELEIDCEVDIAGYRRRSLREMLALVLKLPAQKNLTFKITYNEFEEKYRSIRPDDQQRYSSYRVYWKVLNQGTEAIRRDCIRGQIRSGGETKTEITSFKGDHIVECYIVHDQVVVAKDRIRVPINP
ncbi:nucleotide-binding domain-containing protein [Saccharibacillus sacchari]|uniref:nucleotide-binding domain-containing protein n=1 Tax=Saccharibacillus sacchari TaxID=456493 RepID=UPI0004BC40B6|nr:nucleotidyltransferase [Saccharibacillus sacchari]